MRSTVLIVCFSVLLSQNMVRAQATKPNDSAEVVRAILARVDQLEKRVAELEGRSSPPVSAPPAPQPAPSAAVAQTAPAPVTQPAVMGPDVHAGHMGTLQSIVPSTHIAGFSDFDFGATDLHGAHSGFSEGQFVLHLNSAVSSKVSFFGELSLTARPDAGTGTPPAPGFNVEVERSIIRFEQNDYFKISFGRYHTPINYWNTEFHHGQWLQTTASRPEMVQFGGRFIPVQFVGALVEGAVPAGGFNLNYSAGLGNGRGSV